MAKSKKTLDVYTRPKREKVSNLKSSELAFVAAAGDQLESLSCIDPSGTGG